MGKELRFLLLMLACLVCADTGLAQSKDSDARHSPTVSELWKILQEPLDVKDFQGELNLKEFAQLLQEKLKQRGKTLPLHFNVEAFQNENPDAPSIHDTQIRLAEFPSRLTCAELLRAALRRLNPPNGTFLVRPGVIEVTTIERASLLTTALETKLAVGLYNRKHEAAP